MTRVFLLVVLAVGATGCSSGEEARVAARAVLAEMMQYERLIDRKITAEQIYYTARQKSLVDALERGRKNAERIDVAISANRAAAVLIARNEPVTPADIVDLVAAYVRAQDEAQDETNRKRHDLRTLVTDSLAPLALDKALLQRVRKSLEALQVAPDEAKALKDVYEFFNATREEYDKLRKEDVKEAK